MVYVTGLTIDKDCCIQNCDFIHLNNMNCITSGLHHLNKWVEAVPDFNWTNTSLCVTAKRKILENGKDQEISLPLPIQNQSPSCLLATMMWYSIHVFGTVCTVTFKYCNLNTNKSIIIIDNANKNKANHHNKRNKGKGITTKERN